MSKRANPTIIGAFVVGAIVLAVSGIAIFGSGQFFQEKRKFVMFFDGSVKGLNVGAPVDFRGVVVGSVTEVQLRYDPETLATQIAVFIETSPENITYIGREETAPADNIQALIDRGMRAQLNTQSVLTGLLYIQLDFHPDKPAELVGAIKEYPEIPTIPTTLEEVMQKLEDLPFREILESANHMIQSIDELVSSPELKDTVVALEQTVKNADRLVTDADKLVVDINKHVDPLAEGMGTVLDDADKLVLNIDEQVEPLVENVEETLEEARATLQKATSALENIENLTEEDTAVIYELTQTLKEISGAARAIRDIADYLERHPEALLQGKRRMTK
jgi:paraquat-inducible protein B